MYVAPQTFCGIPIVLVHLMFCVLSRLVVSDSVQPYGL